jgi:hypothetical protein
MFKKTIFALLSTTALSANAQNFGFETGDITGWTSSSLTATTSQTVQAGSNNWVINPYGSYMGTLQIQSGSFSSMTSALGLNSTSTSGITSLLQQQAQTGGGNPTPTTAGWVTRTVTLTAGTQFSLAWQYVSVDYVPFNDGSIASLTKVDSTGTTVVNNYNSQYALLGFTNPGTGDYSTGSYGATGWQSATFNVTESGEYLLGFGVFNLGDQALSPILYIDEVQGTTTKNGETFGAVAPNNDTAPSSSTPTPPTAPTVVSTNTYNQVAIIEAVDTNQNSQTATSVNHTVSKSSGVQNIGRLTTVSLTTPWLRTVTTTPVTVTTYSDESVTTTNGQSSVLTENFSVTQTSSATESFSGRADQAEQFDIIKNGLYRNLNRQNARNGVADDKGRIAMNVTGTKFNGQNGYSANTSVFGLSYETDIDKNIIVGGQINKISGNLTGIDTSGASLDGQHFGAFADYTSDEGITVQNDVGHANIKNTYSRTIGPFANSYSNASQTTWLSTKVLSSDVYGFRPFVGATVLKNSTPSKVESGSIESAQTINGNSTTKTIGEYGVQYSTDVLGGKVLTEVAKTTNGITEANLILSKADGDVTYYVYAGKNWLNSTTSNTLGLNVKVKF